MDSGDWIWSPFFSLVAFLFPHLFFSYTCLGTIGACLFPFYIPYCRFFLYFSFFFFSFSINLHQVSGIFFVDSSVLGDTDCISVYPWGTIPNHVLVRVPWATIRFFNRIWWLAESLVFFSFLLFFFLFYHMVLDRGILSKLNKVYIVYIYMCVCCACLHVCKWAIEVMQCASTLLLMH